MSGKEPTCQCRRQTLVRSLGWKDPLEEDTATHSSILSLRIPWTVEPGGLPSMGSQRVGRDWRDLAQIRDVLIPCFCHRSHLCLTPCSTNHEVSSLADGTRQSSHRAHLAWIPSSSKCGDHYLIECWGGRGALCRYLGFPLQLSPSPPAPQNSALWVLAAFISLDSQLCLLHCQTPPGLLLPMLQSGDFYIPINIL